MTRAELREVVRQVWRDSSKSWVMTGLAFARLAPHILEELDRPVVSGDLFDISSSKLDEADTPAPEARRFGVV